MLLGFMKEHWIINMINDVNGNIIEGLSNINFNDK